MPGVLIELGFVSHPEEGKYLDSNKGKEEIATSISKAIVSYRNDFFNPDASERNTESNTVISDDNSNPKTVNSSDSENGKSTTTYYKVQISAGRKKDLTIPLLKIFLLNYLMLLHEKVQASNSTTLIVD